VHEDQHAEHDDERQDGHGGRLEAQEHPASRASRRAAAASGGTAPAAFNAANEVAVQLFLDGTIPFGRIATVIDAVLTAHHPDDAGSLEAVLAADARARVLAQKAACS